MLIARAAQMVDMAATLTFSRMRSVLNQLSALGHAKAVVWCPCPLLNND